MCSNMQLYKLEQCVSNYITELISRINKSECSINIQAKSCLGYHRISYTSCYNVHACLLLVYCLVSLILIFLWDIYQTLNASTKNARSLFLLAFHSHLFISHFSSVSYTIIRLLTSLLSLTLLPVFLWVWSHKALIDFAPLLPWSSRLKPFVS
jgi:hypothetical protein